MSDVTGREIPIEHGEIDAASEAAQAIRNVEPARSEVEEAQFDARGRIARTVITTKDYLAGAEAFDIIQGLDKGAIATLGTLAGEIYSVEKKQSEYQGKHLTSYWLNGVFQAVVGSTGEVFNAGQAILPKSYGVQVYNVFKDLGVTSVALACTIGLRHAGRNIPHEWVVTDHMRNATVSRVAAMSDHLQSYLGSSPAPAKRIAKAK
jgi:hypothetical protein